MRRLPTVIASLGILALAGLAQAAWTQTGSGDRPSGSHYYERPGTEAPRAVVLGGLLATLHNVSVSGDREAFAAYCRLHGIDPDLPAAWELAAAGADLDRGYGKRLGAASLADFESPDPEVNPNLWKWRELGRIFGRAYRDMRAQGMEADFRTFLFRIEAQRRSNFRSFSDDRFDPEEDRRRDQQLELGLMEILGEEGRLPEPFALHQQ